MIKMFDAQRPWVGSNREPRDPYRGLAASVVRRAIVDLRDPDDKTALDALCFLLKDSPVWLDMAGIDAGRNDILNLLDTSKP